MASLHIPNQQHLHDIAFRQVYHWNAQECPNCIEVEYERPYKSTGSYYCRFGRAIRCELNATIFFDMLRSYILARHFLIIHIQHNWLLVLGYNKLTFVSYRDLE